MTGKINKGTIILKELLEDIKKMTVEEYKEIYENLNNEKKLDIAINKFFNRIKSEKNLNQGNKYENTKKRRK